MITIEIDEETRTKQDMVYALERIIKLINDGCTSGYDPSWQISGEEEPDED